MPAGRKTKYTPEVADRIIDGLRMGLTDKDAAAWGGVSWDSFDNYCKKYPNFSDRVREARVQRTALWLGELRKAGRKDWRAIADLLDRCAPDYRKTQSHELTGEGGGPLNVIFAERKDGPQ